MPRRRHVLFAPVWLVALLLGLLGLPGLAAPALAKSKTFPDRCGDVASANDVLSTKVVNRRRIGVRITHDDLRRDVHSIQFALRSRGSDDEAVVYATVDGSTTWVLDFGYGPPREVDCPGVRVSSTPRTDVTALSVPRSCVGDPSGAVRLSPRVQWSDDGTLGDWSINRGDHFTPYVRR